MTGDTSVTISATGGDVYVIDANASFTTSAKISSVPTSHTVLDGQTKSFMTPASGALWVKATNRSAPEYQVSTDKSATERVTSIAVGSKTCLFKTNTAIVDDTPANFSFSPVYNAEIRTEYTSNAITITGMTPNVEMPISVTGGLFAAGTLSAGSEFKEKGSVKTFWWQACFAVERGIR